MPLKPSLRPNPAVQVLHAAESATDDVKYNSNRSIDDHRLLTELDPGPPSYELDVPFSCPQSYAVVQELGSGGAGKAYLVTGKVDGRPYVAKEIVCIGDKYRAAAASYALHETRLMYLLRHPHIVQLRDFYPKSSGFFIVMEYCEQGDLSVQIEAAARQRVNFDAERIYTWWYQLLDGLDFCHTQGVIHRDLKVQVRGGDGWGAAGGHEGEGGGHRVAAGRTSGSCRASQTS